MKKLMLILIPLMLVSMLAAIELTYDGEIRTARPPTIAPPKKTAATSTVACTLASTASLAAT